MASKDLCALDEEGKRLSEYKRKGRKKGKGFHAHMRSWVSRFSFNISRKSAPLAPFGKGVLGKGAIVHTFLRAA